MVKEISKSEPTDFEAVFRFLLFLLFTLSVESLDTGFCSLVILIKIDDIAKMIATFSIVA